ncbi:hypothetical protein DL96DRAFT_1684543 [Flagelloscypha sp. PMI_526]|nr:hypothetical protein DL96DRAFT_1684543 [Flagelloscypha sp. PMI_526]
MSRRPADFSPPDQVEPNFKSNAKRKSSPACITCRKHKTRCEIVNEDEKFLRSCHRCRILNQPCSFEVGATSGVIHLPAARPIHKLVVGTSPRDNPGVSHLGPPLGDDGEFKKLPQFPRMWAWLTSDADSLDWSSPVASVMIVAAELYPPASLHSNPLLQNSLSSIVQPAQIQSLLTIFASLYDPWLCFTSTQGKDTPLLDLIRCAIASRHSEVDIRHMISQPLNRLAENKITALSLNPPQASMELVQSLLIWSLWKPVYEEGQGGLRDGRPILSIAISMALALHFHQVSTWICEQSHSDESFIPPPELALQAQLWVSICNAESMMCLGTGRLPISRRSPADRTIFRTSKATSLLGGREFRLHVLGTLYDLAERGTCLIVSGDTRPDQWHENLQEVLNTMDALSQPTSAMTAVTDYEHQCFKAMKLHFDLCRLHVLYHSIYGLRYAFRHLPETTEWGKAIRPNGKEVLPELAPLLPRSAQAVIENVIQFDPGYISSMPDSLFAHIAVCVACLVDVKFLLHRTRGVIMPGVSDNLTTKAADLLMKCAPTPDHPAATAADMSRSMLAIWTRFLVSLQESASPREALESVSPLLDSSSSSPSNGRTHSNMPTPPATYPTYLNSHDMPSFIDPHDLSGRRGSASSPYGVRTPDPPLFTANAGPSSQLSHDFGAPASSGVNAGQQSLQFWHAYTPNEGTSGGEPGWSGSPGWDSHMLEPQERQPFPLHPPDPESLKSDSIGVSLESFDVTESIHPTTRMRSSA